MNISVKLQPLIIIISALLGLGLGSYTPLGNYSAGFIEPALMVLLFFVFLSVDFKGIVNSFGNRKFTVTSLVMNFVWTPIFAYALGALLLGDSVDLRIGFLMLMVTPCTDWYLVFTGLAKGNVAVSTMILPLNLILQILLLPVYLFVFMGSELKIGGLSIVGSIAVVLALPFTVSQLVKFVSSGTSANLLEKLKGHGDNFQLFFLCLAIIFMFASESRSIVQNPVLLLKMLVPTLLFFIVNFIIAQIAGRLLKMGYEDTTSLTLTTLARNSPLSLAIAVAAFPDKPLVSLALVIGPLLELPVLAIVSNVLLRMRGKVVPSSD